MCLNVNTSKQVSRCHCLTTICVCLFSESCAVTTSPLTLSCSHLHLSDLRRSKPQSALLFNALFNLHKFLSFENRDPFAMRAEQGEFAGLSDWDKFAKIEYYRCVCVSVCALSNA